MSEVNTPQQEDWRESVPTKLKDVTRFGRNVVGGFMVIFFFWSILFPLSSGVVASGTVISAGQNKAIQHPIGGIVEKLHVRDGQKVVAGQSVITLDPVVDQSEQRRLQARFLMVQALASRLKAQLLTRENVVFPVDFYVGSEIQLRGVPNFKQPRSEYIAELISDQRFEFDAARDRHTKEVATIEAQISTLLKEEQGLSATVKSQKEQLAIISGQVKRLAPLEKSGFIAKNRIEELRRSRSELSGQVSTSSASFAGIKHRVFELKNRRDQVIAEERETVSKELNTVRTQILELANQVEAAKRIVEQRDIKAPVSGVIAKLTAHTEGGVVRPGELIAEIVPSGSELMIETQVKPNDIDFVKPGQYAEIRISAFDGDLFDPIPATVEYVAADSKLNERTEERFFTVRLKLMVDDATHSRMSDLKVGMQGEAFIQSESRVFLSYLMQPVMDSFRRAFREI